MTESGAEYDVARKEWGFYATPSANRRLKSYGFKTAIVRNVEGALYVMLVEKHKLGLFRNYCDTEEQEVVLWMDEPGAFE